MSLAASLWLVIHGVQPHGGAQELEALPELFGPWSDSHCTVVPVVRTGETIEGESLAEIKQQIGEVKDNPQEDRFWVLNVYVVDERDKLRFATQSSVSAKLSEVLKQRGTQGYRYELFPVFLTGEPLKTTLKKLSEIGKVQLPDEIKKRLATKQTASV
jgi:hypothetical protein